MGRAVLIAGTVVVCVLLILSGFYFINPEVFEQSAFFKLFKNSNTNTPLNNQTNISNAQAGGTIGGSSGAGASSGSSGGSGFGGGEEQSNTPKGSSAPVTPYVPSSEELCIAGGGVWRTFTDSCADFCTTTTCTPGNILSCDCKEGDCWDGNTCVLT